MAKKQTRRSISVSRGTYERLKAYCETNQISMSQFVERRVGDFLGATTGLTEQVVLTTTAPSAPTAPATERTASRRAVEAAPALHRSAVQPSQPAPQTIRRANVDSKTQQAADSIFTF